MLSLISLLVAFWFWGWFSDNHQLDWGQKVRSCNGWSLQFDIYCILPIFTNFQLSCAVEETTGFADSWWSYPSSERKETYGSLFFFGHQNLNRNRCFLGPEFIGYKMLVVGGEGDRELVCCRKIDSWNAGVYWSAEGEKKNKELIKISPLTFPTVLWLRMCRPGI